MVLQDGINQVSELPMAAIQIGFDQSEEQMYLPSLPGKQGYN